MGSATNYLISAPIFAREILQQLREDINSFLNTYPPPCPQALLEWTDVEKLFLQELLSCLKGCPPSNTRVFRKPSQTLFRLLFLMSKNQAHELQNGSLGDPKIIKKTWKMEPEWNVEKIGKKHWKIEALEAWKSWFCYEGLQKRLVPPCSKKLQKWSRK